MPSLSMGSVALSPLDPHTVFAGFCAFSGGYIAGTTSGVIKSTNDGDPGTWTLFAEATFSGLLIRRVLPTAFNDPGTGKQVVLVAAQDIYVGGANGGVFRSVDGGTIYTRVLPGPTGASHVAGDPSNVMRFFAGIPGAGISMSQDGGVMWANLNGDIPTPGADRIELSVSGAADPTTGRNPVYAVLIQGGAVTRVFRSSNLGTNWTQLSSDGFNTGGQGRIHSSILADQSNPNVVYVGGDRGPVFARFDGITATFMKDAATQNTTQHVDSRDAVFDPGLFISPYRFLNKNPFQGLVFKAFGEEPT